MPVISNGTWSRSSSVGKTRLGSKATRAAIRSSQRRVRVFSLRAHVPGKRNGQLAVDGEQFHEAAAAQDAGHVGLAGSSLAHSLKT